MTLPIISADERLAEKRGIKGCIFGKSGIGKTSLLWTLPPEKTLFFDLEAGDLAIEGWAGDTVRPRTWQECRDFAVFIGGPNPALRVDQPYSQAHFDAVCERYGDPAALNKYDTVFVDSITVAGRLCFQWCKGQPQAFSDKTGKPDTRGAYGFRFKDWTDYRARGQAIGTGDGATKAFQLVKSYVSGAGSETRTITKPVQGTVVPYLAGIKQTSGWSVNTTTGVLTFLTAPAQGIAVTADFEFDVPVRFDTDSMAVTIEQIDLHQWSDIPVIEIRV